MLKNLGTEIARAFIYHTGSTVVTPENIHSFRMSNQQLQVLSESEITNTVTAHIVEANEIVNPYVDMELLYRCLPAVDKELINFRRIAGHIRSVELEEFINEFPLSSTNKRRLLEAKHLLESDIIKTAADAPLNPATPPPVAPADATATSPVPTPDLAAPVDDNPVSADISTDSLDPKIKERVIMTVGEFLEKNVFQSKITPQVTIASAAKLKGEGYVIKISMVSTDGNETANAYLLYKNNKIQMPAEFFKEEAQGSKITEVKLGDFIPEAIKDFFSYKAEAVEPENGEKGYDYMVASLLSATLPVRRSQILEVILKKYGSDKAKDAFDVYTSVNFKRPERTIKIESNRRVNLREIPDGEEK